MFKRSILFAAVAVVLGVAACKKEETKVTLRDKLTAKIWKSTGFKVDGTVETSWCWLNSLNEYTTSGTWYYTQGDNLGACGGDTIGTVYKSKYVLSADDRYIIRQRPAGDQSMSSDTAEVISITETTLQTKRIANARTIWESVWEDTFTAQ